MSHIADSVTEFFAKIRARSPYRTSIGLKFRAKRIIPLLDMIREISQDCGHVNIIDVGGLEAYWDMIPPEFLDEHHVTITIVNLSDTSMSGDHGHFRFVVADGCNLGRFNDRAFHIAHSNSVIEHVGDWDRVVQFSEELKRVGKYYFVQTPNYWFPIEPHSMLPFFHWLPKPIRIWLVMHFALGHWRKADSMNDAVRVVESARLMDRRMFAGLYNDADIRRERFLFWTKSLIAIRK